MGDPIVRMTRTFALTPIRSCSYPHESSCLKPIRSIVWSWSGCRSCWHSMRPIALVPRRNVHRLGLLRPHEPDDLPDLNRLARPRSVDPGARRRRDGWAVVTARAFEGF